MSTQDPSWISLKKLHLIEAPIALGQDQQGVEEGPEYLLQHGLISQIETLGWKIVTHDRVNPGNLTWNSPLAELPAHQRGQKIKFPKELGDACREISEISKKSRQEKSFTLTLGGDHSVAIGTIGGSLLAEPDLGVIWIDAHGDFNTPETSPSGNIHGMPLSFLSGLMKDYRLPSFDWLKNFLGPDQLVLIGIRSIDPEERVIMKKWGAHVFTMSDIDRYGIGEVMEKAKSILFKNGRRPLHLSYDIDAVDPHFAPSTGTRVHGGLNYREAHYIAEALSETNALVGMDLVEINPRLGYLDPALKVGNSSQNLTVQVGLELIHSALGKKIY